MKALLDTNIIIHREAGSPAINQDIGILYKWLDEARYTKCIHPVTVQEIFKNPNQSTVNNFKIKMESYELLQTVAAMAVEVQSISKSFDKTENDKNDTILINELFNERADLLVTEDQKIHQKAAALGLSDKVFTINSFLEKISSEYPELVDYKVLSVRQKLFGEIDLNDPFFDSFKEDYPGFERWFNKKANEKAYITVNNVNNLLLSFLYLKREDEHEVYSDIQPTFKAKRRLKIGTFKVVSNGVRLGERFLKIVFDNALANKVQEIYVTIFDKREEQKRLILLLESWGFKYWGKKDNAELVYVRDFSKVFSLQNPRFTFPYLSRQCRFFLVPIYPAYHTELFPDSILRTESPLDFVDNEPYRNAIVKVYVSRSYERNLVRGDILVFYRTGGIYEGVITTICIVEDVVHSFREEEDFIKACTKRSVYSEQNLRDQWRYNSSNRPFIVSMLYAYSFPKRPNLKTLIENNIIADINSVPRGFHRISRPQFETILKLTHTDASFIVD
jgi:predicted nucleic acid-binding protein